jgi:thimet oligopeptidase
MFLRTITSLILFFHVIAVRAAEPSVVPAIPKSQPSLWSTKPGVEAFEKLENDRLAKAGRLIDRILKSKPPGTIQRTLVDYDEALQQINAAQYFAADMEAVHPDAKFRDAATAMLRRTGAAQTALSLNHEVYRALADIDLKHADAATQYYVKRQLLEFRLAGVDKDAATRARLKKLNDELTEEQSAFDRNVNDGQLTVTVKDVKELDGLPQDYIDRHKPGKDGFIAITTDYPDYFPVMKFAQSDALRRRLFEAFDNRAYPKNREVLRKMLQSRYEIARILGYQSWADYNAADKMVGHGAKIAEFIQNLDRVAKPLVAKELQLLLAEKRKSVPDATGISVYERGYYQEQLRRARFDFNSQSVRPYFPYARVKQGVLDTAAAMFHVSFRREPDAPGWDPSVEVWDVIDRGKPIGRFYLDMHPRPGKFAHAEMAQVLDGIRGRQLPEGMLICNLPAPTATDAGLMEYTDVESFFHEFGHLMHMILGGHQRWAGISGIQMEWDFVEAPSQMLEEVLRSPQVLALVARHYQTNEPIPAELVKKMNRAAAFGRAGFVGLQNYFTAMSYDFYKDKPQNVDVEAISERDEKMYSVFDTVPGTHAYASFTHLTNYSSGYYTYMWDKVIALDFFGQFDSSNPLSGDAPMRYRRVVLEPGASMSANDLVKNFLGRPQNMAAFERWLGEEFQ